MGGRDPYNCLYEGMVPFHNHFRHTLSQIQTLLPSTAPDAPSSVNKVSVLTTLINLTARLCSSLEMHHSIEEAYIFPQLSKKLPQFAHSSQHIQEHEQMHSALEKVEAYIKDLAKNLRSGKIKQNLESEEDKKFYDYQKFSDLIKGLENVLLPHLQEEEKSLKADSVKKAGFQLHEIQGLIR